MQLVSRKNVRNGKAQILKNASRQFYGSHTREVGVCGGVVYVSGHKMRETTAEVQDGERDEPTNTNSVLSRGNTIDRRSTRHIPLSSSLPYQNIFFAFRGIDPENKTVNAKLSKRKKSINKLNFDDRWSYTLQSANYCSGWWFCVRRCQGGGFLAI